MKIPELGGQAQLSPVIGCLEILKGKQLLADLLFLSQPTDQLHQLHHLPCARELGPNPTAEIFFHRNYL